jgi:long-chain acyl-CoA synthetase
MYSRGPELPELLSPIPVNSLFADRVREFGDRTAVDYFGRKLSYREVYSMASSLVGQLEEKVNPGDVVALATQNVPQFPIVQLALWSLRASVLPINPAYRSQEMSYLIRDSWAKLLIASCEAPTVEGVETLRTNPETFGDIPKELEEKWGVNTSCEEQLDFKSSGRLSSPQIGDLALLLYTSGTTGKPKGVPITQKNVFASSTIYRRWFDFRDDVVLGIAPFYHITGQIFHLTTPLISGSTILTTYRFDPSYSLSVVEEGKTTVTMAVATAYRAMLSSYDGQDLSSMRLWSSGGMPMPLAWEREWKGLTGSWIYMAWGLTETTSPATLWPYPFTGELPVDSETGVVSSGVPVYNTEVMINQEGEVLVRGEQVVRGYWRSGEFQGGWLPTGDLGKILDGWVFILDRKKDVINTSGFKVMPREVEEVLLSHPGVLEAAVVGEPDPYRGEAVIAYVKPKDESLSSVLLEELTTYCRNRLAPYKVPRQIRIVKEIPKTPSGKIMRRALRDREV